MKNKPNFFRTVLYSMIVVSTFSILSISYLWISHEYFDFKSESLKLREQFIDKKKQTVKNEVQKAVEYIDYKIKLTQERLKQDVKLRVLEAHKTAQFIYEKNKYKMTQGQLKASINNALRTIRFFDERNYYFIDDLNGNSILYPPKPEFEGKNLLNIANKSGVKPFPDIIKMVKNKGEGYYIYDWVKYTEGQKPTDKEFPKITYFKHFEPFNWFIAVGEYLDYVESDIRKEIFNRIAKIKFGENGSITLISFDGQIFVSDNQVWESPKRVGTDIDPSMNEFSEIRKKILKEKKGDYFQAFNKKQNSNSIGHKIYFAKAMPNVEFIVEAVQPVNEIENIIEINRSVLFKQTKKNVIRIILVTMILTLLTALFAVYLSKKIKSNFESFKHFFRKAASESAEIKVEKINFMEFRTLAGSANEMIAARHEAEMGLKRLHENLEKKVDERTAQLRNVNKEMETFTYSVSHDLKAPLRGIDGYSRLLVEEHEDKLDEEARRFLGNIRKSTEQMNQLIEDLLSYSRMERRDIITADIELASLIDLLISERQHDIDSNSIKINVNLPFESVRSDADTMRQVIGNFIDNAIKFSKNEQYPTVEISGKQTDTAWTIWVKDNGIGFDPQYRDRIFQIFQRLHLIEEYPGTGVGLAIARKAAERLGSRVWAKSELGKGATFYIEVSKMDINKARESTDNESV